MLYVFYKSKAAAEVGNGIDARMARLCWSLSTILLSWWPRNSLWNSPSCQVSLIFRDISDFASSIPFVPAPSGTHVYSQPIAWDLHGSRLKEAFMSCLLKHSITWAFKHSAGSPGASGSSSPSLLWSCFLFCGISEDSSRGFLKDKLQNFSKVSMFSERSQKPDSQVEIYFFAVCIFNCSTKFETAYIFILPHY